MFEVQQSMFNVDAEYHPYLYFSVNGSAVYRPSPFGLVRSGFEGMGVLNQDQVEFSSQGPRFACSRRFDLQGPIFTHHQDHVRSP